MIRRIGWLPFVWLCAIAIVTAQGTSAPPQPGQTFRSGTDVVFVDVSVRRGGQPVAGLNIADFDLRDNGVRQKVESAEATAVPIDLTLVIDVSGSGGTAIAPPNPAESASGMVNDAIRTVTRLLRPTDRLRVLVADAYVRQVVALQPAVPAPIVDRVPWGGQAAVYDALAAALLQPVDPSRRHVVVAAIKDFDRMSVATATAVREIADRSDALLHGFVLETQVESEIEIEKMQCEKMGLCRPTARFWIIRNERLRDCKPFAPGEVCQKQLTEVGQLLKGAAEATGGAWHQSLAMTEPTVGAVFQTAFDDFRRSYVLRYSPQGVKREGWHAITVATPGQRDVTVRSRRGYSVELDATSTVAPAVTTEPSRTASVPGRASALPKALPEFAAAFDRGETDAIPAGLRALMGEQYLQTRFRDADRLFQDLESAGTLWPGDLPREATFGLVMAEAALSLPRLSNRDREVAKILERYSRLVRHPIEPDALERAYLWAQVCLVEGGFYRLSSTQNADATLARFPDDPRFVLAGAISMDQQWRTSGPIGPGSQLSPTQATASHVSVVTSRYTAAAAFPSTRAEALVRLSWLQHRTGQSAEALTTIDRAPIESRDAYMDFLHHLFRGHYLVALGRIDDAVASYRSAAAVLPGAQSARISLMNALVVKGDLAGAQVAGNDAETMNATTDPWWTFWYGDYRWYQQALAALREVRR